MQSLTGAYDGSSTVTASTTEPQPDPEADPAQSQENAAEEENISAVPAAITTEGTETGVQTADTPSNTPLMEPDPVGLVPSSTEPDATDPDARSEPAPDRSTVCKPKAKDKSDGRKYVPSKKAMTDPLKMEVAQPLADLLTSSQLSLQCFRCHIIFSDHKTKERHLKSNHPREYEQSILRNSLFACYVCDRHFTNSIELMAHQKSHIEKNPFQCPICNVAFKKSSELTAHKKKHYGQDGYVCSDCGKPCKTMTLLKYHKRKHTGERPFICTDCGKRFPTSKSMLNHMSTHLEGSADEPGDGNTSKIQPRKKDGASTVKYPCSVCKATFKSFKTRQHHMRKKHNVTPAPESSGPEQLKQYLPIITPISVCQQALLQVEPNGPLQKVDGNIDTEPIRRMIESMGNIQKVNQVVILGQVPPNAPPLEVPQNLGPTQIELLGLKQTESNLLNSDCPSMEQTIILEPITPDGQLENPSFSELGSQIAAGGNIELTLVPAEETLGTEGEVMQQILRQQEINAIHPNPMDTMICQNEVDDLKQNLEETVILELTPALISTEELEHSQTVPQTEIPSSLMQTNEFDSSQTVDGRLIIDPGVSLSVPPLLSTVELELASLQPEQQSVPSCSLASPGNQAQIQSESDSNPVAEGHSQVQTVDQEDSQPITDGVTMQKMGEKRDQEPFEKLPLKDKNATSPGERLPATEPVKDGSETKQVLRISESPMNVMSAQELVKVRKRKPAQAFVFQGYVQDLFGSVSRHDLYNDVKPAKRQRTKKSHLVVKFGPQNKEKKQKKLSKQREPVQENVTKGKMGKTNLSEKVTSPKKGKKGKKDKTGDALSPPVIQSTSPNPVPQQIKADAKKSKVKKQNEASKGVISRKTVNSPIFKKKKQPKIIQKDQPKAKKAGKTKKNLSPKEKVEKTESPSSRIKQDSLLLLKGHKQPQLKVYKLDPLKTSGQASEVSPQDSQKRAKTSNKKISHLRNECTSVEKKKGRPIKNQKALKLLPSLQPEPAVTSPAKSKTTRKRKASSKVETEGVITSKRDLQCKDCGERFSEVSSLQKHKTMVHIVESPSLTYTNGNIFEGVSNLDIYQLPKDHTVVGVMNAAADWDTEPEMALEDKERNVSFPALIPSPSLPIPPSDVEMSACEDMFCTKTGAGNQPAVPERHSPSVQMKNNKEKMDITSEYSTTDLTPTKACETAVVQPFDGDMSEAPSQQSSRVGSEVHSNKEEDIKDDLVLEVDLVTVGEQSDRDAASQNQSSRSCDSESPQHVNSETTEIGLTLQTVSCSTHPMEIKEEEEELLVQKNSNGENVTVRGNASRNNRRITRCVKKDMNSKSLSGEDISKDTESEKEQDQCDVVYEKRPLTPDSGAINSKTGTESSPQRSPSEPEVSKAATLPICSTSEESHEEPIVFESATTNVHQVTSDTEPQEQETGREADESPAIILEKFLTSGRRAASACQEIKMEIEGTGTLQVCQNRLDASVPSHDTRTVLVKEESYLMLSEPQTAPSSKHIRWNVEPVSNENTTSPFVDVGETPRDHSVSPEFSTHQCIFYPVKEEEREVVLGATQTSRGSAPAEGPSDTHHIGQQTVDHDPYERSLSSQDYQETGVERLTSNQGVDDLTTGQDPEWQHPPDLRDYLLQSSDEEDTGGFELSDPQLESEAAIIAYFSKDQSNMTQWPGQTSWSEQASSDFIQGPTESRSRQPIDYFCTYFNWDTWIEFTSCTNKHANMPKPVTCREVTCFVGIHIAMGTLKFPSPRLYWEDLTKVSLIAEAMPLSRFLELNRMLKFTSPSRDQAHPDVQNAAQNADFHKAHLDAGLSTHDGTGDTPGRDEQTGDAVASESPTDPLWKVQPILRRFAAGCQTLRQKGDYAVDQYVLPLTGRMHSNKPSLHCTTLIGFSGLVSYVDLKLDLSDKEDAVEKMVPKGSMAFLCKQELSTPAMLERLLAAGVHGAGRVGGARGQIGDEFVSSDGKLMLRRSHCGFILSTAGNGQRNMALLTDNFEKAQMSARLNRDLQNLYKTPLTASTPTCWPHAVLWYLVDLALVNSWLMYRRDYTAASPPLTLMAFRLEVSKALILSSGSDTQDSAPPQPPKEKTSSRSETPHPIVVEESPLPDAATRYDGSGHWPEQLAEGEGGRCRFGNCQRTSRVLCLKCCVFLCISRNHNCFLNFHNQEGSDKE